MGVERIDLLTPDAFLDGPTEFLAKSIACFLLKEEHFSCVFGESIVAYDKEDFMMRELPALRVYNLTYVKEQESHYINGDVKIDVIFPALLRREETEELQNRVAAALLQQFRRPGFFMMMQGRVHGLNELGKVFSVDKTLGYQNSKSGEEECPTTQITLNFRIDLKQWDAYLESNDRTKDDPFEVTLGSLKSIGSKIRGIKGVDPSKPEVEIDSKMKIGD